MITDVFLVLAALFFLLVPPMLAERARRALATNLALQAKPPPEHAKPRVDVAPPPPVPRGPPPPTPRAAQPPPGVSLRRSIVMMEILGPPRALRPEPPRS